MNECAGKAYIGARACKLLRQATRNKNLRAFWPGGFLCEYLLKNIKSQHGQVDYDAEHKKTDHCTYTITAHTYNYAAQI